LTATQAHTQDDRTPRISPRRAATRQRLLTAATTVIAERGVNGASVEAICEEAGFTRGAFYSNFTTKEDLLNALMGAKHDALLDGIRRTLEQAAQAPAAAGVDVVDDLVEKVLAVIPTDRESRLMETEINLYMIRNPDHAPELQQVMTPFREELARLVMAGLARAGRRLAVGTEDAVNAIHAGYETGANRMLIAGAAGGPTDPNTSRRTLALVIKAISEPV
jgi:AcrR family transcriptional regulator